MSFLWVSSFRNEELQSLQSSSHVCGLCRAQVTGVNKTGTPLSLPLSHTPHRQSLISFLSGYDSRPWHSSSRCSDSRSLQEDEGCEENGYLSIEPTLM